MPSVICRVLTDDGIEGLGEGVPDAHVTGETVASTFAVLSEDLGPLLLGQDPRDLERVKRTVFSSVLAVPTAKAAIEIALNDILGKSAGLPVHRLYGGRTQPDLELFYVVSLDDPEGMAQSAAQAIRERGHRGLKLKLGQGGPALEESRVRAIRAAVGDDVPIRIDANQGWGTAPEAVTTIRRLERYGPLWIEQPVTSGDLRALAEVRSRVDVPIMADEAVRDAAQLLEVIRLRAADMVNVKLMKCGGISEGARLAQMAGSAGMAVQVGSMVESGIGSLAGAQLAAARPEIVSLETSGPLLFTEDVVESPIVAPRFSVGDAPGLGVTLLPERLGRLSVRTVRLGEAG